MPDATPGDATPADATVTDATVTAATVTAVIEANRAARAGLLAALEGLTAEPRQSRWFGEWSLHDIVAHLYEWQDGFAHALERMARGERPEIPDYAPEDGDDVFNAMVVERNRHRSWQDLLLRLRTAQERHEAAVRGLVGRLPAERFEDGRTARRLADSAEHDQEHTPAIIEWRLQQGI